MGKEVRKKVGKQMKMGVVIEVDEEVEKELGSR